MAKTEQTHVLVVDPNHARRRRISSVFRAASCPTFEAVSCAEVRRVFGRTTGSWLLAVADSRPADHADRLRDELRTAFPSTPQIAVGSRRLNSIAGRIHADDRELASHLHGLVDSADPSLPEGSR